MNHRILDIFKIKESNSRSIENRSIDISKFRDLIGHTTIGISIVWFSMYRLFESRFIRRINSLILDRLTLQFFIFSIYRLFGFALYELIDTLNRSIIK